MTEEKPKAIHSQRRHYRKWDSLLAPLFDDVRPFPRRMMLQRSSGLTGTSTGFATGARAFLNRNGLISTATADIEKDQVYVTVLGYHGGRRPVADGPRTHERAVTAAQLEAGKANLAAHHAKRKAEKTAFMAELDREVNAEKPHTNGSVLTHRPFTDIYDTVAKAPQVQASGMVIELNSLLATVNTLSKELSEVGRRIVLLRHKFLPPTTRTQEHDQQRG